MSATMTITSLTVVPIETPTLGDRTYLVHDGEVAFVVDPQRDIDRVTRPAGRARGPADPRVRDPHPQRLRHRRARAGQGTGAAYLVNAADEVSFERTPIADGETVLVGDHMRVTALATPGHTFTHLSYALTDTRVEPGNVIDAAGSLENASGVFSGGSLLFGATGRPDLLGAEHTHELVHHQHASAQRLAEVLPDAAEVFPTHGFGSFCSATQSDATESTIGQEKQTNPVLTQDEETYVRELLGGLGAYPAYYAHMAPANAAGPDRARPDPAQGCGRGRAASSHRGRRMGRGPAQPDRLRRRPRTRDLELRHRRWLRDLSRLADPVGHTADPARRER